MQFHYTLICYTYSFILDTYYCLSTYNVYLSNVALACLDDIATVSRDEVRFIHYAFFNTEFGPR